jgi:hypothetical protein
MIAYAAKQREIRICAVCGAKFSATGEGELCPVCILRGVPSGECLTAQAADSASGTGQSSAEIEHGSSTRRFEHYEVMLDKDGKPIELGRGAMGVTYKALAPALARPVTARSARSCSVGRAPLPVIQPTASRGSTETFARRLLRPCDDHLI